ncbi:hypothetical protein OROMI_020464 [Orobanche minor]
MRWTGSGTSKSCKRASSFPPSWLSETNPPGSPASSSP